LFEVSNAVFDFCHIIWAWQGLFHQPQMPAPLHLAGPVLLASQLPRIPRFMTRLQRRIVENPMSILDKSLNLQAEIDAVAAICELIDRARWTTVMQGNTTASSTGHGSETGGS
jgi:hypothetical protein